MHFFGIKNTLSTFVLFKRYFFKLIEKNDKLTTNQHWQSAQTRTSTGRWRPEQRSPRCGAPSRRGRTLSLLTERPKPASLKPNSALTPAKLNKNRDRKHYARFVKKNFQQHPHAVVNSITVRTRLGGPFFSGAPWWGGPDLPTRRSAPRPALYVPRARRRDASIYSVWIEDNN